MVLQQVLRLEDLFVVAHDIIIRGEKFPYLRENTWPSRILKPVKHNKREAR